MYFYDKNVYVNVKNNVLFDLNKINIYKLDIENLEMLKKYYIGIELGKNELELYNNFLKTIEVDEEKIFNWDEPNYNIETVKIHVSNDCNMRCKYCYAHGGNYGTSRGIMSFQTAQIIANKIQKHFPNIKNISFFGGEPLLAIEAIEVFCKVFTKKNVDFMLQTNGTILNDEIEKIIKKYNIIVTVSIDGPKQIHDMNRIDMNGKPTYDKICTHVKRLNSKNIAVQAIQATYTKPSAKIYTKEEISKILNKEFGISYISVCDVQTEIEYLKLQNTQLDWYEIDVEKNFEEILKNEYIVSNIVNTILDAIFTKSYFNYFCYAGLNQVSIGIDGKLWPCQLFVNDKNYEMGNIIESNFDNYISVIKKIECLKKSNIKICNACLARFWCSKCLGISSIMKTDIIEDICLDMDRCLYNQEITRRTLDKISEYVSNDMLVEFQEKYCSKKKIMELI